MYCSRQCYSQSRRIGTVCPNCKRTFWYHKSWPRKYCSARCAGLANMNCLGKKRPITYRRFCIQCGKEITGNVKWRKSRFCSLACFGEWQSIHRTGPNSGNWRGGHESYYGPSWHTARRAARKRDGYTCQRCGKQKKELAHRPYVHHKIPFREFGLERHIQANDLSNLISVCSKCHGILERKSVKDQSSSFNS